MTDNNIKRSYAAVYWKRNLLQKLRECIYGFGRNMQGNFPNPDGREIADIIMLLWLEKARELLGDRAVIPRAKIKLEKDVREICELRDKGKLYKAVERYGPGQKMDFKSGRD